MEKLLLSCDWGTSSFRLRLLQMPERKIVAQRVSAMGVASVAAQWKGEPGGMSREAYFSRVLNAELQALQREASLELGGVPLWVSGMASSSLGWHELPYAELPFALDGSRALVRHFPATPDFPWPLWLVSGVRAEADVMRGEETELLGLAAQRSLRISPGRTLCIFPGTHAKHMVLEGGNMTDFRTYMTGELFALMRSHSLLRDTGSGSGAVENEGETEAFVRGVEESPAADLLHHLFAVRAKALLEKMPPADQRRYLSGLLIGHELGALAAEQGTILLCGGGKLSGLYKTALDHLGLASRSRIVDPALMERAAADGHLALWKAREMPGSGVSYTP